MERLLSDLLWLYEQDFVEGSDRDEISHIRFLIAEKVDGPL